MGYMVKLKKITGRWQSIFTLKQANALFPIVYRITQRYVKRMEGVLKQLDGVSSDQTSQIIDLELEKKALIRSWTSKMKKLGVKPCCQLLIEKNCLKCCWVVEFDAGDGYFCWKYPEPEIGFWHRYFDGNTGRIPIEMYLALQKYQNKSS